MVETDSEAARLAAAKLPAMRASQRVSNVVVTATAAAFFAGCGGSGGGGSVSTAGTQIPGASSEDDAAYTPRASTVGDGLSGVAPTMDPSVAAAAKAAGCTVRTFPADSGGLGVGKARTHVTTLEPGYSQSIPPTSGPHNDVWADWGYYTQPVPYRYLVHNMEHGGVEIHYGSRLKPDNAKSLAALWAEKPAYMVVVPDAGAGFPKQGVVVTSWQRWMVCKPFGAKSLPAIRAFRDTYRGVGPEQVPSKDAGANAPGLPKPAATDPKTAA